MGLTNAQLSMLEKARSVGSGNLAVSISDSTCKFLLAVIASDLDLLANFPEFGESSLTYFDTNSTRALETQGQTVEALFERLLGLAPDADTYFSCLAALEKSRLKYAKILQEQPLPTMDQVGPRSLLQFGSMSARLLAAFLFWRKWLFDIDNRSGQETGYLFEPIIAHAIGGVPVSARRSPVRRREDPTKGRQVDCIRQNHAYEIKIRVTIAASGQGRWREELTFPSDCRESGYTPVLVVLDPTPNPKLDELQQVFRREAGETHIGQDAWNHLENVAGDTMAIFLEKYVRTPIEEVLKAAPELLPEITFAMDGLSFRVSSEGDSFISPRAERVSLGPDEADSDEDESLGP